MADNVVGIKFGVLGGGSISGESGRLIKSQLNQIAQNINIKVKASIDGSAIEVGLKKIKEATESSLGGEDNKLAAKYVQAERALEKIHTTQKKIKNSQKDSFDWTKANHQLKEQQDNYEKLLKELKEAEGVDKNRVDSIKEYNEQLKESVNKEPSRLLATDIDSAKLKDKAESLFTTNGFDKIISRSKKAKEIAQDFYNEVNSALNRTDEFDEPIKLTKEEVKKLNAKFLETQANIKKIGRETDTVGNKIKEAFNDKVIQNIAAVLLAVVGRALKQIYDNVVKLDQALTNLQIATGYTRAETAELMKTYASLANQLGATMLEVSDAADTWLRQGYSVAETNQLIANSLMLAKLGQLSSTEAAKALTSAMKGYKVSVEDASKVVDKFTAVDMQAAVSAGDIATAMAETAASADVAGVSMDKLIGYIATVAEVTQDGAESVGIFYKTLFARMGNVKAGKFVDDETGESLNDVEKVLGELGVSLRDDKESFRNFGDVLDEVAKKWEAYTPVQKRALATAFAGAKNQEKFLVLMENYGDALDYAATAANSAGTAQQKYSEAYLDSIEAKLNELTASWQEFSQLILNSELIKGGVGFLTMIVGLLNKLASLGDGMLVTIPAITLALIATHAILLKIKASAVFTTMWGSLRGVLAIFPAILAGLKSIVLNIYAEAVAHSVSRKAIVAKTAATQAAIAAQSAFNKVSPVGWMILAVSVVYALVKGIKALADAESKASEKAKEEAEKRKELADKAKEEKASLDELIDKYAEVRDSDYVDADKRKEIRDIQKQINLLVGDEARNLDLVNDGLDSSMKKLKALKLEQARQKQSTFTASYSAAENSVNKAHESDRSGAGWAKWAADLAGIDVVIKGYDKSAADILNKVQGVSAGWDTNFGSSLLDINFDASGADDYVRVINNAIEALENDQNYNHWDSETYNKLVQMRDAYMAYVSSATTAADDLLTNTVSVAGLQKEVEDGAIVDSIESYEAFKNEIEKTVSSSDDLKKALAEGRITQDDITEAVNDYMSLNFPEWYNKIASSVKKAVVAQKDFLKILDELEAKFDTLESALSDIDKQGIVSADTISKLLQSYPELEKYFKLTPQGYVIADDFKGMSSSDILKAFMSEYLQSYVDELAKCEEGTKNYETAQNNLNNAIAVCATLLRSKAIEEETDKLNDQKDALENQLNQYKDLIDVRKDLLSTYADEVNYQKTLAQKQKAVADLQTQLALARMDNSASGQAKVRQLESELADAQDALDDFTLEKAIDVLTAELDDQYDEYKQFIDEEVAKLEDAIKNIKLTVSPGVEVPNPTETKDDTTQPTEKHSPWKTWQDAANAGFSNIAGASASERGRVTNWTNPYTGEKYKNYQEYLDAMYRKYVGEYHTGGFVGDESRLKSNEGFAKLLRGEFVSTPKQIDVFMKKTLPSIANQSNGMTIEYNSPLVEVKCDSITEDSLPKLNDIINKAVEKIKKDMTGALSRTGYRKQY